MKFQQFLTNLKARLGEAATIQGGFTPVKLPSASRGASVTLPHREAKKEDIYQDILESQERHSHGTHGKSSKVQFVNRKGNLKKIRNNPSKPPTTTEDLRNQYAAGPIAHFKPLDLYRHYPSWFPDLREFAEDQSLIMRLESDITFSFVAPDTFDHLNRQDFYRACVNFWGPQTNIETVQHLSKYRMEAGGDGVEALQDYS